MDYHSMAKEAERLDADRKRLAVQCIGTITVVTASVADNFTMSVGDASASTDHFPEPVRPSAAVAMALQSRVSWESGRGPR